MTNRNTSRIIATVVLMIAVITAIAFRTLTSNSAPRNAATNAAADRLVAHEWGTFTSIAGKDGVALEWRPLNGSSDLPKFVHTIQGQGEGLRHGPKANMVAAVRMMRIRVSAPLTNRGFIGSS